MNETIEAPAVIEAAPVAQPVYAQARNFKLPTAAEFIAATLQGGGIVNGGTFTISNSTVASNSAATGGGIFINSNVNGSTLTITIFHYL